MIHQNFYYLIFIAPYYIKIDSQSAYIHNPTQLNNYGYI